MKILYLLNQRFPTEKAYGIQVEKMCQAFSKNGAEVSLIHPFRRNQITEDAVAFYGIKNTFFIRQVNSPDFYFWGRLDRLSFWLKNLISAVVLVFFALRSNSDIIYSRDELPIYFLSFWTKRNPKLVFEAHGFSNRRKPFYSRFLKKKIKIIAITESIKKEFIKYGFLSDRILTAHDGCDPRDFEGLASPDALMKTLNLPQSPVILYAGHLYERKGADVLARAADRLKKYNFVFIGGTTPDIARFRSKYGDVDNIFILGRKSHQEAISFMTAADVLVLPNIKEDGHTSPLKLFEYMASKKPIVASDLPEIREILNETNSVLVESGNPASLADGIKSIYENPQKAGQIAQAAFTDVKEYFWPSRAHKIINFLSR